MSIMVDSKKCCNEEFALFFHYFLVIISSRKILHILHGCGLSSMHGYIVAL
jgi:hypothetical protein